MRFKIDLASLIVGRKFAVFFNFVFEGNFQVQAPGAGGGGGGLHLEGRFNGWFFALRFWRAYIWRGLFSEFYGILFSPVCLFNEGKYRTSVIPSLHVKW